MSKSCSLFFASTAFVAMVGYLYIKSILYGTISPLYILFQGLFAAIVFALIGFFLGRIFEEGRDDEEVEEDEQAKIKKQKQENILIDDILIYDIDIPRKKEKKEEISKDEKKEENNEQNS